ncbi:rhodanese family protein [Ferrovibrio sp. MS7]|jgi:rhodanese-related sulfurtransferase|uniref:rhodanese-like domain-containing protein n=1 Tax=Ferrovibrio plantarum TaxID=3119164 RepID=UPI00313673E0
MSLQSITADRLKTLMDAGQTVLIDIREPSEHAREHILGARLAPLSAFDQHDFDRDKDKIAVFHCKSGNRTAMNAAKLAAAGFREAYILQGGLDAWRKAGLPLHENRDAPIDLMRQVQITAGSLVALGALLAWLVSPWFIMLSGFVGAGLVFAGVTGFCGMARLLALMPWNRRFSIPA